MPPIEQYRSEAPGIPGSINRGNRAHNRDVFWPIFLYSRGDSQDWIDLDRAFWRTMQPGQTGTWTVVRPGGVGRSVDLRYESDTGTYGLNPIRTGWAPYGINLTAEQPFWREDPIKRRFTAVTPVSFLGSPGVLNISSPSQLATASIPNPGDVAGWIVWTLSGPFDAAVVGVGGKTIDVPIPLAVGEFLTVWTAPEAMGEVRDGLGVDRTDELGAAAFTAVQPGDSQPLSLQLIGPGPGAYIEASLTPYYFRAW
jgi:hypothetical protein